MHARLLTRTRETQQDFSLVLTRYAILRTPTGKRPVALARLRKMMGGAPTPKARAGHKSIIRPIER